MVSHCRRVSDYWLSIKRPRCLEMLTQGTAHPAIAFLRKDGLKLRAVFLPPYLEVSR